jgi:hypothetical protein
MSLIPVRFTVSAILRSVDVPSIIDKILRGFKMGIPTQCMKSLKCSRAKPQYFANVSLK